MALDRPVIVTGTPRSGKTCVSRIVSESSEFLSMGEQIMMWDVGLGNEPDDRRTREAATAEVKRQIIKRCERLLAQAGKRRYEDNLSYHALRLPFVYEVLPDVRVIHVVRDPEDTVPEIFFGWTHRDTLRSAIARRRRNFNLRALPRFVWHFARNYVTSRTRGHRATWGPRVPGLMQFAATHSPAEVAAHQWARMVEIALTDIEAVPEMPILTVRYEELAAQPRLVASRIAEFTEAEEPQSLVTFAAKFMQSDYVHFEVCRAEPTRAEWEAIHRIIAPMRARLGYETRDRLRSGSTARENGEVHQ